MHRFNHAMAKAVEEALKRLLSEKHLYQNVEPETGFIQNVAENVFADANKRTGITVASLIARPTLEEVIRQGGDIMDHAWLAYYHGVQKSTGQIHTTGSAGNPIQFQLPTIMTFCDHCKERWPFNPVPDESSCVIADNVNQSYCLTYQCQTCKRPPIRFLVRREGRRLRLCGRDPLEVLPISRVLPKSPGKYFSDATIAHHAGQTLAGIFLLRVFIEQYWQTTLAVRELVNKNIRATGDEQGTEYQKTLPEDFKSRFPSLSDIYGKLSAAMHTATADATLFEDSCSQIVEHFEARRMFKLD
jgi:hypothetical protein